MVSIKRLLPLRPARGASGRFIRGSPGVQADLGGWAYRRAAIAPRAMLPGCRHRAVTLHFVFLSGCHPYI
jgi:hypothetical protein